VLLFDRFFGGNYSVFAKLCCDRQGAGIVVATLSHDEKYFSEFSDANPTIQLSYTREADIPALTRRLVNQYYPDWSEKEKREYEMVDGVLLITKQMLETPWKLFPILIQSPKAFSVYIILNWLSPEHPAFLSQNLEKVSQLRWKQRHRQKEIITLQFYLDVIELNKKRKTARESRSAEFKQQDEKPATLPPIALKTFYLKDKVEKNTSKYACKKTQSIFCDLSRIS
jgi:hypothetical protein